eukprot:TRINITY_DN14230_c0_g1_i2.p1 TRINITY_DN14230_c0_g1~~TRINITY_DN14230_c0_g1_i2.p1  ORF type:complete len:110 (+),score=14.74 TRINITY_DN14230_c0_g1_i2:132-461(+)
MDRQEWIMLSTIGGAVGTLFGYLIARRLFPPEQPIQRPRVFTAEQLEKKMRCYLTDDEELKHEIAKVTKVYCPSIVGLGIMRSGVPADVRPEYAELMTLIVRGTLETDQ